MPRGGGGYGGMSPEIFLNQPGPELENPFPAFRAFEFVLRFALTVLVSVMLYG
jgi:hypothetical protein